MSGDLRAPESGDILRGIIRWCRQEDVAATRTRLMKLMYLADLHFARNHDGATATGWRWRLDAFGPLAAECYALLERGEAEGWLRHFEKADAEGRDGATHFYYLPAEAPAVDLGGLGRVKTWIKTYGHSTHDLLRFVYGETEPMQTAVPGEELDFSTALPPPKWIQAEPLTKKARKRLHSLVKEIVARQVEATPIPEMPRDEGYYQGLPKEEPIGLFELRLEFEKG